MWGKKKPEFVEGDRVVVIRPDYIRDQKRRKVKFVLAGQVVVVYKDDGRKIHIQQSGNGYLPRSAIVPLNEDALTHLDRYRFWQCLRRFWSDGFYPSRYWTWAYLTGRAITLGQLGKADEAIQTATKAIPLISNGWTAYVLRASCLNFLNEFEAAIQDCNEALKIQKTEGMAYYYRGEARLYLEQHEEAIRDFDAAIQYHADIDASMERRGYSRLALEQYEEAINDFDAVIKNRPNEGITYLYRGAAKFRLGQCEDAIQDFDTSIQLNCDVKTATEYRGHAKQMLERYAEALLDFDKVLDLDHNSFLAKLGRVFSIRALAGPTEALAELEKLKAVAGNTAEYQIHLAYTLFQMEQLEDAKGCFAKALKLETKHPASWYGLAVISMLQRKTEHLDDFVNALKCGQRADLEMHLYSVMRGVLYSRILGEPHIEAALLGCGLDFSRLKWPYPELQFIRGEISEEDLLMSANKDPEKGEAYCTLGLHYLSQQDRDKAAQYFRMSIEVGTPHYIETTISKFELKRLEGQVTSLEPSDLREVE